MVAMRRDMSPARHPWIEEFQANPAEKFADFLAGYAHIEPYGRAEPPDAARMIFGPLASEDVARRALDQTIAKWLDDRRHQGIPAVEGPALDRMLREVTDAIRIVSVLSLQQTAADFRKRIVLWNSWVERLAEIPGPDVRAALLSTLALTQRVVLKSDVGVNPFGLEPHWLRLCEQAGSQYPSSYVSIGLLGLRMLPERKDMPSERPWMAGLARWASAQKPKLGDFSRQWWALKVLYPSTPNHWREALADTLRQEWTESLSASVRDFWEKDVGLGKPAAKDGKAVGGKRRVSPAPLHVVNSLLDRIREPFHDIASELHNVIAQDERYAEATGDSWYLARAATILGMNLIESAPADEFAERGKLAVELARKALSWASTDVHVWALWRDALEVQDLPEAAELVGWEAIRRFPEDAYLRTQLAGLLARLPGRKDEAESLLRETRDRFPEDPFPVTQLSHLLAQRSDEKAKLEAESLLRGLLRRAPDGTVPASQLAYLLARRPDRKSQDEAEGLLRDVLRRFPDGPVASSQLASLLAKRPDRKSQDEAEGLLRDELRRFPNGLAACSQLASLLAKRPDQKDQDEAEGLLRDVLRRDPGNVIASRQLAYLLAKRTDRKDQDEAEGLLRDVLRGDPDNVMAMRQLGYLLAKRSDRKGQDEAEGLLRDALRRDPNNDTASRQLALLVAKRPSRKDQNEIARPSAQAPDLGVETATTRSQAASAPAEQLEVQHEIDRVLEESIGGSFNAVMVQGDSTVRPDVAAAPDTRPAPSPATKKADKVDVVSAAPPAPTTKKIGSERAPADMTMAVVRRGGRLRRLAADLPRRLDDLQWRHAAAAEVERVFAEDENFVYAQYLRNELGENDPIKSRLAAGTFATAFVDAIKRKDSERFKDLEFNHPAQSQLLDVARAWLFEDRAAADRAVRWLNAPADGEPRSIAALRAFFERRFGVKVSAKKFRFVVTDPDEFLNLVAANDNNVRLDLIESALVPAELALAA